MMVDGLPLQSLDLVFKLDSFSLLLLFLLVRPLQNSLCLLLVKREFLLFLVIILVHLCVLHFKLRDVVSGFVLVGFEIELNYGAVTDW